MLIAEIVIFLLIFLILITQRIDVRITKRETTTIYVHFIFIAIRVGNGKKHKIELTKVYQNRFLIKSALNYLLPRTDVKIHSLTASRDNTLPATVFSNILLGTLLTYLKSYAKSVIYTESHEEYVDVEISFILYHIIISFVLGQYYKMKSKILRN